MPNDDGDLRLTDYAAGLFDTVDEARAAGDTWVSRSGWEGETPEVSKTVAVVVPNRAYNQEIVPFRLWAHWISRATRAVEDLFEGSTIYIPALGTFYDGKQQHIDQPFVIESVAPSGELRKTTTIKTLVHLCQQMATAMDQDCVLLLIGGLRLFVKSKAGREGDKLLRQRDYNDVKQPDPTKKPTLYEFSTDKGCHWREEQEYAEYWGKKRLASLRSLPDPLPYLDHYNILSSTMGWQAALDSEKRGIGVAKPAGSYQFLTPLPSNQVGNRLRAQWLANLKDTEERRIVSRA